MDFLDRELPYYDKNKAGDPIASGTVLEHLKCAIQFTKNNTGFHGLPLLGFADWNDTVNLEAGAESLFVANLYGTALLEMIELFKYLGDNALASEYTGYYEDMRKKVNEYAWDGKWYVRYFENDGNPLGSQNNSQGKIYINAQTWAVISGFADSARGGEALGSVYKFLNTKNGLKLSWPGYNGYDREKGGITTYPPGAKENGGIFLHCNPWAVIAEAKMGNGNRAFQYYNQINPVKKNDVIDEYECEPYCYSQNILGDEHPQFGTARNSWLSGTASWAYQAAENIYLV
jgi:cellobiose phosphorylase